MRALAHDSCQVPPRYQVKPGVLSVESGVFTSGASSEIRRGRLGYMAVAIRTLKTCGKVSPDDVQKVRAPSKFSSGCIKNVASNLALLQGVHHLDERFSPPPLTAHCHRHRSSIWPMFDDFGDDAWENKGLYQ